MGKILISEYYIVRLEDGNMKTDLNTDRAIWGKCIEKCWISEQRFVIITLVIYAQRMECNVQTC